MEKLSKLLNEYLESKKKDIKQFMNIAALMTHSDSKLYQTYIISKDFEFIKRLVENDKIDRDKELKENWLFRKYFYDLEYVKNYDRLVMWLSVEDDPISFLISLLK